MTGKYVKLPIVLAFDASDEQRKSICHAYINVTGCQKCVPIERLLIVSADHALMKYNIFAFCPHCKEIEQVGWEAKGEIHVLASALVSSISKPASETRWDVI